MFLSGSKGRSPRPLCVSFSRFRFPVGLSALLAFAASATHGATSTWDAGSSLDFNWDTLTNWSGDVLPTAADDVLLPTPIPNPGTLVGASTITLGAADVARSLTFRDSYTLTGGTLTFNGGGITVAPTATATVASQIIATNLTLDATNGLAGPDAQVGGGVLVLSNGTNSLLGTTTINAGTLRVTNPSALGTANTINSGGTLEVAGIALDRNMSLNDGATLFGSGASVSSNGTMTVAGGASVTINSGAIGQTFSLGNAANDVTGGGAGTTINIGGAGTVVLTQSNNVTANWKVNSGALQINNIGGGGLGVAASTVTVESGASFITNPSANATIANAITLHGGTLNNNSTLGQLTIGAAGINVTADSTIRNIGTGTLGKIIIGGNLLTGSGNITKVGQGVLTFTGVNSGYTGSFFVNEGVLEGGTNMLGSNLITINGGEVAANTGTLSNAIAITAAGGALSSVTGAGTFAGPISAGGAFNVNLKDFNAATARSTTISGNISGTGPMTVLATAGAATLTLSGNNTAYTGAVTIGNGTGTNPTLAVRGITALSGKDVTLNGGVLSLLSDGNGTGSPQTLAFDDNLTVSATSSITVGRLATEFAPLFLTALNKTVQLGTLSIGGQTLTITNNNGYGVNFTGQTTLTNAPTFSVATASVGSAVQGLTLSGKVTGSFGINKAGAGTLALGSTANDFVGNINVTQGVLSISSDAQLGNPANVVLLNPSTGTTPTSTLRATDNITTSRVIQLTTAANTRSIEVVGGKTLTLTSPFDLPAPGAALIKADSGTLALTAANVNTWTGGVTINGGAVLVSNAAAFGSPASVISISPGVAAVGAALQLAGGITLPNNVILQGNNNVAFGGINFGGQLQSVSGVNTTTGSLILNFDAAIGADAGATLNINGGINNTTASARQLILNANGTINLNSALTSATATPNQFFGMQKWGTGTLNITTAQSFTLTTGSTQNFTFADGTTNLMDGGTLSGTPTIAATVLAGAKLTVDNTLQVVGSRLGGRGLASTHGSFDVIGGASAVTEAMGALGINRGHTVISVDAGAGGANLTFGAPTRAGGSTALFRGTELGTVAGPAVSTIASTATGFAFSGAGAVGSSSKGMLPWALADTSTTGLGLTFATADTATGIIRPLAPSELSPDLTSGTNVALSVSASSGTGISINSLTLGVGGGITNASNGTLTVTSGGILALPGNSGISEGFLTQGTGELIVHALGDLDLNSTIVGGSGGAAFALTKAGAGNLTLNQVSRYAGQTTVTQGTLTLNAGRNTIGLQNYMSVNKGATVDLKGSTQLVTDLFSDSTVPNNAGTVKGTAGSMIVLNRDNSARNWAGTVTGAAGYARAGANTLTVTSDNTYTGPTILTGGNTTLRDRGAFSGTSRIDIGYATLRLDNAVGLQLDVGNRINDAAPITLKGGVLILAGRNQAATRENLGALTLARGTSELNVANGTVGSSSVELSFASLNQANNATTNFQTAAGAIGNSPRIFFGNGVALLSNNILPAWIEKGGNDFASYNATQGLGGLADAGFAGYDATTIPAVSQPTQNISITTAGNVGASVTINVLRFVGTAAGTLSFTNTDDTLSLGAGGFLKSGSTVTTVGASPGAGKIAAGTATSTGVVPLYFHANSNNTGGVVVNSRIVDANPSAQTRFVGVIYNGGTITIAGENTHTGGTVLQGWAGGTAGSYTLAPTGVIPAGGLTINNANFTQQAGGVIHPSNVLTITGANSTTSGAITLTGNNTLAGLVFDNDGGTVVPTLTTGGVLTLTGGITATSNNLGTTPVVNGTIDLGGTVAPVDIAPILIDSQNVAPFLPAVTIGAVVQNGGITKTGNGVLALGGANTYGGPTNVNAGVLQFANGAAGVPNSTLNLGAAGTLNLNALNPVIGGLAGSGSVVNTTAGFPVAATNTLTFGGNGANSTFPGLVSGAVALSKVGGGTFTITNPANSFTGGIVVNGGTMILAGAGNNTTGSGAVSVSNGATLSGAGLISGGLAFNAGSSLSVALSGAVPIATGTSGVSVSGPVTINLSGAASPGLYSLIDYGGSALSAAQFAGFKLGATPGGGLLYGLINNSSGTSVDLVAETLGATNTWTGATNGNWVQGDASNWTSAYDDGQRVTFTNAGTSKAITGGDVSPQQITVNNSVGNEYSIANNITGALAGGLLKSGTGTLRLAGVNTFGGPVTVDGGTLRVAVSTGISGLGSGNTVLNNATLQLNLTAANSNGLTGRLISGALTSNVVTQRDFNQSAADVRTYFATGNVDTTNTANPPFPGGPADNYSMQWTGKINIVTPGNYSFFSQSDDGSRVFIDGRLVAENDGSHGIGTDVGGVPIFLTPGYHDVRIDLTEGTGNFAQQLRWQGPGFVKALVTSANVFTAENSSAAASSNNILLGNNVAVNGTSVIDLVGNNFTGVELGGLSPSAGSTLQVTGLTGKQLRASSTSFAGGTVTINAIPDVALGQVLDNGTPVTLVKKESGRLILDNTGAAGRASSLLATSTIDVQAGKLVLVGAFSNSANGGTDPAGAAKIQLSGGGLLLDTKGSTVIGSGTTTFDNAIVTTQNATIESLPVGNGVAAAVPIVVALGSSTNGITLANASTLTLDVYGGARNATALGNNFFGNQLASNGSNLVINGVISGAAGIAIQSSQFNGGQMPVVGNVGMTAANTVSGPVSIRGQIYNAPNVLGGGLVTGAATSGAPLTLALSGNGTLLNTSGIVLNTARLTLDAGGTNNGNRIADTLPIALNSSVLQFLGNTTAASGETIGVLSANGGYSAVAMSGVATGFATTLTADSLTRLNRSQLAIQGNALGTAATAANQLKFTNAPTGTLTNGVQLVGNGAAIGTTNKDVSILPFAVGTTNVASPVTWRFVGYDAANGARPLDVTNEMENSAGTTNLANVRDLAATAATITARATPINSWIIDDTSTSGGPHIQTISGTVTINSGAMLLTASSGTQQAISVTGGTIAFGGTEGVITTMANPGSTIASTITGTNGLTIGGNGQTALTGDNSLGLTGTITVNGQLAIGADVALGDPNNPVAMNGGILKFTAATALPATRAVTLFGNTISGFDTNTASSSIAGAVTGSGSLVKIGANTLTISNSGNNYTGPTEVYAGSLVTTTGPTGNYLNNGNVTFDQSFDATYAGLITGFGSFTKAGTGRIIVATAQGYSGVTSVTNGTLVLGADNVLPFATAFTMGNGTNPVTLDASNNQTFSTFAVTGSAADALLVAGGKTLTALGATSIGGGAVVTLSGGGTYVPAGDFNVGSNNNTGTFIVADASFNVTGGPTTNLNIGSKTTATAGIVGGTLDVSALPSFNVNVGRVQIAVDSANQGGVMNASTLRLAPNNTITAATSFVIGDSISDGTGSLHRVLLGAGANVITTPLLTVGGRKLSASMTIDAGGTLVLNNGVAPTDLNVGVNVAAGSATAPTSHMDMSGGTIVATLNNVVIGGRTGTPSGTNGGAGTGTLTVGTSPSNLITANTVIIGQTNANTGGTAPIGSATGTLNMNGGALVVGSMVLAEQVNGTSRGTFNVLGGATALGGDLTDGGGISALVVDGGTLDMSAHNIGSAFAPIDTVTFASGTLRNVAEVNGGALVTKTGPGTLVFEGNNTYTGPTTVAEGKVIVNGTLSGTLDVSVVAGATLGGSGTIAAPVTISGTLAPGASAGDLTVNGGVFFDANSKFIVELNGPTAGAGFGYDQLTIGLAGSVSIGLTSEIELSLGYFFANVGQKFTLIDNLAVGPILGTFDNLPNLSNVALDFGGGTWVFEVNYAGGDGNDLTLTTLAVPEPVTGVTLLGGLALLAGMRRNRRRDRM